MTGANAELVEGGDLDELVRHVGRLCRLGAWEELEDLRHRCRAALERGRQLWPVASLVEYRLALDAPGEFAGRVLIEGTGHLARGPLPEVAASTHGWEELAPHIPDGPVRALTAHERVVRGEDLSTWSAELAAGPDPIGLPHALQPWEPAYPIATYEADGATFPRPELPPLDEVEAQGTASARTGDDRSDIGTQDPTAHDALRGLVTAWTAASNGRADTVAVRGRRWTR